MAQKLYFITGSQDLYGEKTLEQVAADSRIIADYLDRELMRTIDVIWKPTVRNSDEIVQVCIFLELVLLLSVLLPFYLVLFLNF